MTATLADLDLVLDRTADRSHRYTPACLASERLRAEPVTSRLGRAWVYLCYVANATKEDALRAADVDCGGSWSAWHAASILFGTPDRCPCAPCSKARGGR